MNTQPKNMIGLAVLGAAALALGGCAQTQYTSSGPWQWTAPVALDVSAGGFDNQPTTNSGSSSAVIVSPGHQQVNAGQFYAYNSDAPEYDRRDESLSIRTNDPYAGWMGYPEEVRPSLNNRRTYQSGRNAEQYVYPSVEQHRRHGTQRRYRYR